MSPLDDARDLNMPRACHRCGRSIRHRRQRFQRGGGRVGERCAEWERTRGAAHENGVFPCPSAHWPVRVRILLPWGCFGSPVCRGAMTGADQAMKSPHRRLNPSGRELSPHW